MKENFGSDHCTFTPADASGLTSGLTCNVGAGPTRSISRQNAFELGPDMDRAVSMHHGSQKPKLHAGLPDEHSLASRHGVQSAGVLPGHAASNAQSHDA